MLKRVLTIAIIMTGSVLLANAHTKDDFTPKKGDKSVSLNLGVGSFVGMEAPAPDLSTYNISAPQTSWFDKQLSPVSYTHLSPSFNTSSTFSTRL